MFLYGGPDQIIPLASALSTIAGVAMIFWGRLIQASRKLFSAFSKTTPEIPTENKPQQ